LDETSTKAADGEASLDGASIGQRGPDGLAFSNK
jgi:hypothetical protein